MLPQSLPNTNEGASSTSRAAVQITTSTVTRNDPAFELSTVRSDHSPPRKHVSNIPLDLAKEQYDDDDLKQYDAESFRRESKRPELGEEIEVIRAVTYTNGEAEADADRDTGRQRTLSFELTKVPPAVRR